MADAPTRYRRRVKNKHALAGYAYSGKRAQKAFTTAYARIFAERFEDVLFASKIAQPVPAK